MANDYEALARALMSGAQGQMAGGMMEKLSAILKTEDGRQLLTLLANGGADTIKGAAQATLRGDENAARAAMLKLLSTQEGAALARKLAELSRGGR